MKQVFILNVAEQAALARGHAQVLRLADGSEFEFRFERAAPVNGTRPRGRQPNPLDEPSATAVLDAARARKSVQNRLYRARKLATQATGAGLKCPKCATSFPEGRAIHQHLRQMHKLSAAARYKLFPKLTDAAVRARRAARDVQTKETP